jgi:C4-dicarboxylate-specific signal transduction histidine kinase
MKFFYKILLGYISAIVLLSIVFVGAVFYNITKHIEDKDSYREREITSFVEVLDAVIDSEQKLNEAGFAQSMIDNVIKSLPHIKRFSIHAKAPQGQIKSGYWHLASSEPARIGKESDPEDIEAFRNKTKKVLYETAPSGQRSIDITYPITDAKGAPIATVGITVSLSEEDAIFRGAQEKILKDSLTTMAAMLFVVAIFAVLISAFIARRMTVPLQELKEYAQKISSANFKETINIKTGDEFEDLAGAFNAMSAELAALYDDLEKRIDERTADLMAEVELRQQAEEELTVLNQELDRQVKEGVDRMLKQEMMLVQQSKMAAMGEMIGMIAHQWKQPLNHLGITVQDVVMAYKYGEVDEAYVNQFRDDAMGAIGTMAHTIDDFKNFFSPNKKVEKFFVEDAIADTLKIIMPQLGSLNISVVFDVDLEHRHECVSIKNEFKQVVLNLIANAKDAIAEKQEKYPFDDNFIKIQISENGSDISVDIVDSGLGIPESVRQRLFEQYFTTKEEGKGTGLGLYMSKMIIEDHLHGKLSVATGKEGSTFTITLNMLNS